jgi:uncharacterized damage-inducible protein DinB
MRHDIIAAAFTAAILSAGPVAAQAGNPISDVIKEHWADAKRNLTSSAQQMPEDGYAFRPVETVRTFGQILAHIAGANYLFCAAAKGEKSPYTEEHFEKTAKTRAEIRKAVNDSVAYCDPAYSSVTDKSAAETIARPFGSGKTSRASALMGNSTHIQEHYGNLVTYFRIKGMVPPTSQRQTP